MPRVTAVCVKNAQRARAMPAGIAVTLAFAVLLAAGAQARAATLVAYQAGLSGSRVWVMNGDGASRRQLGAGQHPIVSPSGSLVAAEAVTEQGNPLGQLVVYSLSGAQLLHVSLNAASALPLAFSPDSRYLAVSLSSEIGGMGLAVLDVQTGTVSYLSSGTIEGASFDPQGADELVFGRYASRDPRTSSPVNLYTWAPNGGAAKPLTNDGRSLNPVWGDSYIAYDRERLEHFREGGKGFSEMQQQIWLRYPNGSSRQLTHRRLNFLQFGVVPVAISASGTHIAAELEQQDIPMALAVKVPSGSSRTLVSQAITHASGISSDGSSVLVWRFEYDGADQLLSAPFGGGPPTVLLRQRYVGEPSWSE